MLKVVDEKWMNHIDSMDELKNGIGLRAYGQQDPVVKYRMEGMDMFEEMKTAAYLQKVITKKPDSILPYDILKMATIDGAKVLGLEKEIGTLEPGKKADMIFIKTETIHLCPDNEICSNIVYSANGADVDSVMVDGKLIMQNRKMININEKEVMRQVKKIAKRLL